MEDEMKSLESFVTPDGGTIEIRRLATGGLVVTEVDHGYPDYLPRRPSLYPRQVTARQRPARR